MSIMQGVGARPGAPQRQAEALLGPGGAEQLKKSSGMLIAMSAVRSLHLGLWFLSRCALARHSDALQHRIHCHCIRPAMHQTPACAQVHLWHPEIVCTVQGGLQRIWREPPGKVHPHRVGEADTLMIWAGHGWMSKRMSAGQVRLHSRSHHI